MMHLQFKALLGEKLTYMDRWIVREAPLSKKWLTQHQNYVKEPMLNARSQGKLFASYSQFIASVESGNTSIVFTPKYVVLSNDLYKELCRSPKPEQTLEQRRSYADIHSLH